MLYDADIVLYRMNGTVSVSHYIASNYVMIYKKLMYIM